LCTYAKIDLVIQFFSFYWPGIPQGAQRGKKEWPSSSPSQMKKAA
jgi:hypothetical protein